MSLWAGAAHWPLHSAVVWIASRDDIPHLWTDDRTRQTLTFYTRTPTGDPVWSGTVSAFGRQPATIPDDVGDGPLLVSAFGPREKPSEADGWRLIWQSSDRATLRLWER